MPKPPRVSISHSRQENEQALLLARALAGTGAEVVFYAEVVDEMKPSPATLATLHTCDFHVFLITPSAQGSLWMRAEMEAATASQVHVLHHQLTLTSPQVASYIQQATVSDRNDHSRILVVLAGSPPRGETLAELGAEAIAPMIRTVAADPTLDDAALFHVLHEIADAIARLRQTEGHPWEPLALAEPVEALVSRGMALLPAELPDPALPPAVWCPVANITDEESANGLRGTKHFAPGARVICLASSLRPPVGRLEVLGKHRGGSRTVRVYVGHELLTNLRVKQVYTPHLVKALSGEWDGTAAAKAQAEEVAAQIRGSQAARDN